MRRVALALLLAIVAPVWAAQAQVPPNWAERVPPAALEDIRALISEAEADGLPVEPLIQKALEGSVKGVAADRIVSTLRVFRAELRDARYLLGSVRPEAVDHSGDIVGVAFALHRGLRPAEVRDLLEVAPEGTRDVALQIAADITARGYAPEDASQLVADAVAQRLSPDQLLAIPRFVFAELERGAAPDEAMTRVRVQLLRGQPGRAP